MLLFALFVAVQLRVLFGGAAYVQRTTGLGYGEYARQGFVQLLAVAALTLTVIGVAARRRDRRCACSWPYCARWRWWCWSAPPRACIW